MADYSYWQNALAGNFGPVHDGDAQPGFWRKRTHRAGPFQPCAIWEQDGKMLALVAGKAADPAEIWTFVCRYPILEDWYRDKMDGKPWPDEDKFVNDSFAPPAGHNQPGEIDSMKDQIEAALKGVDEYAEIKDDQSASRAQSLRSRLLELRGEADKKREAIVRPHLDAQTAANAVWMPLVKSAKAAADKIATALGAHETRKENARKAAEAKRIAAIEAGKPAPPPPEPVPVPAAPAPTMTVRGAYGRAASVKTIKKAKVVDQDAAYGYLKSQTELVDLIAALAQKAVTAGLTVPGVEVEEVKKVV